MDVEGKIVVSYSYNAWGEVISEGGNNNLHKINQLMYKGYVYDREINLYYCKSRYYNPEWCRFINADDVDYVNPEYLNGLNLFAYCGNDPINKYDPTGHFMISTAVLIGAIIGAAVLGTVGGVVAYNVAEEKGAEGWELVGWTVLGALGGAAIGAVVGGAIGYGIGYLAGGTYANGLVAKSVGGGVKTFLSQANKVHHVLGQAKHKLVGYTTKTMGKLMKKTLAKGVVSAYGKAQSAYWAIAGSEVTFVVIDGVIKISDMWIR